MAEFQVVMRQYKRMCECSTCDNCPFCVDMYCDDFLKTDPVSAERIILEWAAEHPEPRYPTWLEWWIEKFPDAEERVAMCNFTQCPRPGDPDHCNECINSPIPADIAKKLGIEPVTEEE